MKVSELTITDLSNYLRMESDDIDAITEAELTAYLDAAKSYAVNYTGHTESELDEWAECAIAVLCLAADYYSDRDMIRNLKGTGTATTNQAVQSILDMHSVNLIPVNTDEDEEDSDEEEDSEDDSEEDE